MALPLLPVNDIQKAYDELNERIPVTLEPLFDYFESWWMKQVPLSLWNVSTLQSRTNNNVEGKWIQFIDTSFLFNARLAFTFQQTHRQETSEHMDIHRGS